MEFLGRREQSRAVFSVEAMGRCREHGVDRRTLSECTLFVVHGGLACITGKDRRSYLFADSSELKAVSLYRT